ncbi:MAG: DUF4003 family protein [Clostridiales bacterium]|nr:DUF4003 family protein [Clostridiales bacterium]
MNDNLKKRCELFIQNRNELKSSFYWQNSMLYPVCANFYVQKNKEVDCDRIKECRKMIKKHTGAFSNFRGISNLVIATLLSLEENPEAILEESLEIYQKLKKEFHGSAYLTLTAMVLSTMQNGIYSIDAIIKKAKAIYKGVKSDHPMITSSEDSGMVVLLALCDKSEQQIVEEVQRCYELLKPNFFSANATQALSFVLALSEEDPKIKCPRAVAIYNHLKDVNCKYGRGLELAILGVIAIEDIDMEQVGNTIQEINQFLLNSKGFGAFGVGRAQRIMYATMLMMYDLTEGKQNATMNTAAITSVTSIIIAQQIAICAAASSAVAASAANN